MNKYLSDWKKFVSPNGQISYSIYSLVDRKLIAGIIFKLGYGWQCRFAQHVADRYKYTDHGNAETAKAHAIKVLEDHGYTYDNRLINLL